MRADARRRRRASPPSTPGSASTRSGRSHRPGCARSRWGQQRTATRPARWSRLARTLRAAISLGLHRRQRGKALLTIRAVARGDDLEDGAGRDGVARVAVIVEQGPLRRRQGGPRVGDVLARDCGPHVDACPPADSVSRPFRGTLRKGQKTKAAGLGKRTIDVVHSSANIHRVMRIDARNGRQRRVPCGRDDCEEIAHGENTRSSLKSCSRPRA